MLTAEKFPEPVHILCMHTYSRNSNIIMAPTERSMFETYKECFKADKSITVKSYLVGNIINLPARYVAKFRSELFKSKLRDFQDSIQFVVGNYFLKNNEFPPHTEGCTCLPKNISGKDIFQVFPSHLKARHKKCEGLRFLLKDRDWYELFFIDNPTWECEIPPISISNIDEDDILLAYTEHSEGIVIERIPAVEDFHFGSVGFSKMLFAFTGAFQPIPNSIETWTASEYESIRKCTDEWSARKSKERNEAVLAHALAIFNKLGYSASEIDLVKAKL